MRQQRYKRLRAVFWKIQKCIHTYIIFKSQLKTLKVRALLFYIPADESFIAADRLVIVYDLCNREHYVSKFMVPNFMMELLFIFRLLLIQRTSYDFIKTVMHSKYKTRAKNVYICEICCFSSFYCLVSHINCHCSDSCPHFTPRTHYADVRNIDIRCICIFKESQQWGF